LPDIPIRKVVIDTTTIRSGKGRLLGGPVVDLLRVGIKHLNIKLYAPQIVVEEAASQYKRECRDRLGKIHSAAMSLKQFLISDRENTISVFELNEVVDEYRAKLTQRCHRAL
jgi:predicted nucleic acid-binding protein